MSQAMHVLVVGGVACGPKTSARIKRLWPEAKVTMIEKTESVSFGACGLPYYIEGVCSDIDMLFETPVGVKRSPQFFQKVKGFDVLTQTEAMKINPEKKTVLVRYHETGKEEELAYDKLVLATGSSAFMPPIPGIEKGNIWKMKNAEDGQTLVEQLRTKQASKAVIIGAGLIGVEVAEALIQRGLEVTVVEMFDQILPQLLDKEMSMLAGKHMQQKGIKLALGQKVVGFEGQDVVQGVKTEQETLPADIVVVSVGVRPNDQLAREAGLDCHPKGGIRINHFCQTSDTDIYAGGDCVVNDYIHPILGSSLYVPLGSTANKHGRVIANNICGQTTTFPGVMTTSICKSFDDTIGRTGMTEEQARQLGYDVESIIWGGPDSPHYIPTNRPMIIKMIADRKDRTVLGVQVVGQGDASKRLDVAAAAIFFRASLEDFANIDLGYAPPYSPPIDPIATTAQILGNKIDGLARGVSPLKAKEMMEATSDIYILDVRTPSEFGAMRLPDERVVNIPLGELRQRCHEIPDDKEILTFCKVSLRGYEAQRILQAAGKKQVSFIEGGLLGWPYELWMA
jgi:NADPH-dependent 2,4-dienoyl-CoA reductase/sulfur reductase-like enzyme/rhodanese-related sulfurtransferase